MNTRSLAVAFVAAAVLSAAADSAPASAKRLPATIDGDLSEWTGAPQVEFVVPPVKDLRPEFCALGWDDANLYVAFRVLDSKFVNANGLNRIGDGDSMELRVCPGEAARGSFLRLVVSPTSDRGVPALSLTRRRGKAAEKVASAYEGEESDVKWRVAKAAKSWTVEAAVPFSALGASPKVGAKLPFVIVCWDRDNADKDEWGTGWKKRLESSKQKNPPEQWPCVALGDENAVGVKKIGGGLGIARHDPCNMFRPDEDVEFALKPKFPAGAKGSVVCTVRDAYGREYLKCTRPYPAEGGAGALSFEDCALNDIDLDMGVGELSFKGSLGGKCDISLGVGKADFELIGTLDDYEIRVDKGIGAIYIDGESRGNGEYGDGDNTLDIDGGIGEINIRFASEK